VKKRGLWKYESETIDLNGATARTELKRYVAESGVEATLHEYERVAKAILGEAGFPDHMGPFGIDPDGARHDLKDKPTEKPLPGWKYCALTELLRGRELEPEWRSAQILFWCNAVRSHLKKGNARDSVWASLRLQSQIERLMFSEIFERDTLSGRKARHGAARGGASRAAGKKLRNALWAQEDSDLLSSSPHLSASARARIIAKRRLIGPH